ncbi:MULTISPECIES: polysaccharide biosynthesis tyrosine autokinase [unclassified Cupriavidus]|uniref:polysaccharide biosynthesis tyrosine autokinase n=1 Tax=unclassified Cupriavidus TaxID=2640874 RepID=UPI001C0068FA|nr:MULTISPECIES: polysaccharide biosynthesis tyrosine autokinase [unclassified Cupriavidus]MCA3184222.1 polysaccharide biosynthesis tyrosine autokinase [Cupriavidus sp.]MCA3193461.1 polysaccharide biosynthesis tyrosine autokinase [Cupriavidus sp.]MCA3199630.1 polysaccharide biosynthesis tyrosine autokinase [Cupriavidus sp.]MCA3203338.1 polysaccharide biosynthesis tyrosine autokinase [Cupriavidus sp.]MCA3209481.1 polysaccharide biosynthesis tyrosine autokinase [Cupriavidus sp.]
MSFAAGAAPAAPATAAEAGGNPWRAMLDRAGWILGAGLAGGAIAWVFAVSQPHEYSASALVQVQQPRDNVATARTNALSMTATPMPFDVGLLRSRTVVAPVVERLHLDISARPLRAPLIGGLAAHFATPGQLSGPWPESLGYAWGGEQLAVERLAVPERLLNVPLTLLVLPNGGYRLYDRDTELLSGSVGNPAEANGVAMQVASIDARPGTRFVVTRHDLVQTVDAVADGLRIEMQPGDAGTVSIGWRNADRTAVAALVNGITESFIGNQAMQRRDDTAATLAFLSGEIPRVKAELERAETALTKYRSKAGSIAPTQDAQSYLTGSMDYQRQIAVLKLERMKLLQRFTEEANEVKTVDNQIQQLVRERKDMDSRYQNLSSTERESVALTRDVKVAEDMYMTLRNKAEQLSLLQLDRTGQVRVLDSALLPMRPVGLGPWPATMAGALMGLCLAMACVAVRQRVRPTLDNVNDAEARLGLPMLGDIVFSQEQVELERLVDARARSAWPDGDVAGLLAQQSRQAQHSGHALVDPDELAESADDDIDGAERLLRLGLHDQFLLARNAPHSMAVEGLRNVRAALHFSLRDTPQRVVAVTSPTAGAGKTFASVNLAVLFAEAGQRVLLIDADLRRGKVANWLDLHTGPGFADVLSGRASLPDAVQLTAVNGLSVLPAGAPPDNPSELLMSPAFARSLQTCAERFDLVMIDTPPVMAVADAALVANCVNATLLVLRADTTLPSQVDESLKRLARANATLLGGILNGVVPKRSNRTDFTAMNPYLGMPVTAPSLKQIGHTPAA